MTTPYTPVEPPAPPFEPNAEQLERAERRQRFLRLYVYLPLGLVIFISIAIIILLLVAIFSPNNTDATVFTSALADIIVILGTLPLLLLCAIVPLAYLAYVLNRRQRRQQFPETGPLAEYGRLQIFLWRLDSFVATTRRTTQETAPKVADPVIRANARFASVESWLKQVAVQLRLIPHRENDNERKSKHLE